MQPAAYSHPATSVGNLVLTVLPFPSCPEELLPQHFGFPPMTAQVNAPPEAGVDACSTPGTGVGTSIAALPSCPVCLEVLSPQHSISPREAVAQTF